MKGLAFYSPSLRGSIAAESAIPTPPGDPIMPDRPYKCRRPQKGAFRRRAAARLLRAPTPPSSFPRLAPIRSSSSSLTGPSHLMWGFGRRAPSGGRHLDEFRLSFVTQIKPRSPVVYLALKKKPPPYQVIQNLKPVNKKPLHYQAVPNLKSDSGILNRSASPE